VKSGGGWGLKGVVLGRGVACSREGKLKGFGGWEG
jgi:hypothetical protein